MIFQNTHTPRPGSKNNHQILETSAMVSPSFSISDCLHWRAGHRSWIDIRQFQRIQSGRPCEVHCVRRNRNCNLSIRIHSWDSHHQGILCCSWQHRQLQVNSSFFNWNSEFQQSLTNLKMLNSDVEINPLLART